MKNWTIDKTFEPEMTEEQRKEEITGWDKAVKCSFNWAKEE